MKLRQSNRTIFPLTLAVALAFGVVAVPQNARAQCAGILCIDLEVEVSVRGAPPGTDPSGAPWSSPHPEISIDRTTIFEVDPKLCSACEAAGDIDQIMVRVDDIPIDMNLHPPGAASFVARNNAREHADNRAESAAQTVVGGSSSDATDYGKTLAEDPNSYRFENPAVRPIDRTRRAASDRARRHDRSLRDSEEQNADDPVHAGTGEMTYEKIDLELTGIALPFTLTRYYRSGWLYNGPMGWNWTHSYDQKLLLSPALGLADSTATTCGVERLEWMMGDGGTLEFSRSANGIFESEPLSPYRVEQLANGNFQITTPEGLELTFRRVPGTDFAVLDFVQDLAGNMVSLGWQTFTDAASGATIPRLQNVLDTLNRAIVFEYGTDNYLDRVVIPALGIEVEYIVDDAGDLRTVRNAANIAENYIYASGHSEDLDYFPTSELDSICEAACGVDSVCPARAPCATAAAQVESECLTSCNSNGCKASCGESCPRECRSHRLNRPCAVSCDSACTNDCRQRGDTACLAAATGPVVTERCSEECTEFCNAKCDANFVCQGQECFFQVFPYPWWVCNALPVHCIGWNECSSEWSSSYRDAGEDEHNVPAAVRGTSWWTGIPNVPVAAEGWKCHGAECYDCCHAGFACPSGSCQQDRPCIETCQEMFLDGGYSIPDGQCRVADRPEGCQQRTYDACDAQCKATCDSECADDCIDACDAECTDACNDPDWCRDACRIDQLLEATCEGSCVATCKIEKSHSSGRMVFGHPRDLNHNLIQIHNGEGELILENIYGEDVLSPDFDRVVIQALGGNLIEHHHFKLNTPGAPEIPAAYEMNVDAEPESIDVCATACLGGMPGRETERWVRVSGNEFLVLGEALEGPMGTSWPIEHADDLNGYAWFELRKNGDGYGTIDPILNLVGGGLFIETGLGTVHISQDEGPGTVKYAGLTSADLDAVFAEGVVSLIRSNGGWRAYPGRVKGGARMHPGDACVDEFGVGQGPPGSGGKPNVEMIPALACDEPFAVEEMGRPQPEGGDDDWLGFLTDPRGLVHWLPGEDGPRRSGFSAFDDPWNPAPDTWDPLCGDLVSYFEDPACVAVIYPGGPYDDPAVLPPDCGMHFSRRHDARGAMGRGQLPVGLGCDDLVEIPPLPPEGCVDETYIDPVIHPSGTGRQQITGATIVKDGNGTQRVFYSDRHGRILRIVNVATDQRMERVYDELGRLVGVQNPHGDRECLKYDNDWNVVEHMRLPAPSIAPNLSQPIEQRLSYGPNARIAVVYDPEAPLRPLVNYEWRANGTLERATYPGLSISVDLTHDAHGRLETVTAPSGVTRYEYDVWTGALTSIVYDDGGPDERTRLITPDTLGRPQRIEEDGQPLEEYTWAEDGRLLTETITLDPAASSTPQLTTYNYDQAGRLSSALGPTADVYLTKNVRGATERIFTWPHDTAYESRVECFGYDGRGAEVEHIDAEGRKSRTIYDGNGDVVRIEAGVWGDTAESWDDSCLSNLRDAINPRTEIMEELSRDPAGLVLSRQLGAAPSTGAEWTTHYVYDGFGRPIEARLANGVRDRFAWDRRDRVRWSSRYHATAPDLPAGLLGDTPNPADLNLAKLTNFTYDDLDRPLTSASEWFVDENGSRRALGTGQIEWVKQYLDATQEIEVRNPEGRTSRVELDYFGRVRRMTAPDGTSVVTSTWLDNGRRVDWSASPSNGGSAGSALYTPLGELAELRNDAGQTVLSISYDDAGRPAVVTGRADVERMTYDPFGELVSIHRVRANATEEVFERYERDRTGEVRRLYDGLGSYTEWSYDALGRPMRAKLPGGSTQLFDYREGTDAPSVITEPNNDTRTLEYDAFGEVSRVVAAMASVPAGFVGTIETTFERNATGLVGATTQNEPSPMTQVVLGYVRDSRGAAIRETSSLWNDPVLYTRDVFGRPEQIDFGANWIRRGYDELSRLDATSVNGVMAADYAYNGFGRPTSITYGNNLVETITADGEGRLRTLVGRSGSTQRFRHELYYGTDGTLARFDRQIGAGNTISSVFRSDELGRVDRANHGLVNIGPMTSGAITDATVAPFVASGASRESFALDAADSWTSYQLGNSAAIALVADARLAYTEFAGRVDLDAVARTRRTPENTEFIYDGYGRLVTATLASGTQHQFAYDPFNRLVRSTSPTQTVQFQTADDWIIREAPSAAAASTLFVPGDDTYPIAVRRSGVTTYNHAAFGGRLSLTTGQNGAVGERYDYTTYGLPTIRNSAGSAISASTVGNRLLITGKPYYGELGLHSFGYRWYRPQWGRFLTPDPLGFADGPNRFAYAGNQPLMFVDPWGLIAEGGDTPREDDILRRTLCRTPGRRGARQTMRAPGVRPRSQQYDRAEQIVREALPNLTPKQQREVNPTRISRTDRAPSQAEVQARRSDARRAQEMVARNHFDNLKPAEQEAVRNLYRPLFRPHPFKNPVDLRTEGRTPEEIEAMREYARRSNEWLLKNGPQTIHSTKGPLRREASAAAARERRLAEREGRPYEGQAGHVPDSAVTGLAEPPAGWLDMPGFSNSIAGGALGPRVGQKMDGYLIDGVMP